MNPDDTSQAILLASASPRRRRLFQWLGLDHNATSTDVDESLDPDLADNPARFAEMLATRKANAARAAVEQEGRSVPLVLGFDTIVVSDGKILGKPIDRDDARRMLRELSGRTHEVITGLSLLCPSEDTPRSFTVATPVNMRALSEADIDSWLAGEEALGCAGAYNIEHHLASVEIDQCFQNVAGLPLCHLYQALRRLPITCLGGKSPCEPIGTCDSARGVKCKLGPALVEGVVST